MRCIGLVYLKIKYWHVSIRFKIIFHHYLHLRTLFHSYHVILWCWLTWCLVCCRLFKVYVERNISCCAAADDLVWSLLHILTTQIQNSSNQMFILSNCSMFIKLKSETRKIYSIDLQGSFKVWITLRSEPRISRSSYSKARNTQMCGILLSISSGKGLFFMKQIEQW